MFPPVAGREVVGVFDGGDITSNTGFLLLADADRMVGLTSGLGSVIRDARQNAKVGHSVSTLIRERVFAIAAGYEDANDLDDLRRCPALKVSCGRASKSGDDLASQPTMSRFENSLSKKDLMRMGVVVAERVIAQLPAETGRVVLDIDATEDPCHGQQEFEFFNGFYDSHCYLPLLVYITDESGRQRLLSVLLRSGKAGNSGVHGLVRRAVSLVRARFPAIDIVLRADAGFGNDKMLRLCDKLRIGYVLALSGNRRLHTLSSQIQMQACCKYTFAKDEWQDDVCRVFGLIDYKAGPWDKKRPVVVKAEITQGALNPRFVVTNQDCTDPAALYAFYCARGDRENRIKEFKLDLAGGRTSCHRFLANQGRVLLHAAAAVLMETIKAAAAGTCYANAQASTLRLRLIKLGARVVETTRKIWLHMSSSYPDKEVWMAVRMALT
jgi:hypothetical protein